MKRPKRLLRARRPPGPVAIHDVRVTGSAWWDGEDLPIVEVAGSDGVPQMVLDRAIGDVTKFPAWVRAVRPDDAPDTTRAINPTPERLADAGEAGAEIRRATHVLVQVVAPGIRARRAINVYPHGALN